MAEAILWPLCLSVHGRKSQLHTLETSAPDPRMSSPARRGSTRPQRGRWTAAGSKYGYRLLWVVLLANLMAMVVQAMSAKLGIATGRNLPEVCAQRFSTPTRYFLW